MKNGNGQRPKGHLIGTLRKKSSLKGLFIAPHTAAHKILFVKQRPTHHHIRPYHNTQQTNNTNNNMTLSKQKLSTVIRKGSGGPPMSQDVPIFLQSEFLLFYVLFCVKIYTHDCTVVVWCVVVALYIGNLFIVCQGVYVGDI